MRSPQHDARIEALENDMHDMKAKHTLDMHHLQRKHKQDMQVLQGKHTQDMHDLHKIINKDKHKLLMGSVAFNFINAAAHYVFADNVEKRNLHDWTYTHSVPQNQTKASNGAIDRPTASVEYLYWTKIAAEQQINAVLVKTFKFLKIFTLI
jgi:hypothetical protein